MCRWLERDPAGYQDGPSLYSYLGRNPMAGTDPYGLAGLYSVSGDSQAGDAIRRRLAEIDASKPSCRSGSKREEEFGSEAKFRRESRINPDRREDLGEVGQGIGTAIETTASVLPGGGFATAVNEASKGNFGEAALNVVPGEKVAGPFVSLFLSKAVLVKFASGERAAAKAFSYEKQALVDMAQADRRVGITEADMQAYKDLNRTLPDPFPEDAVRGPEMHSSRSPHSRKPHGHVGPVDHIPIRKDREQ
jgi:hypothetical protein